MSEIQPNLYWSSGNNSLIIGNEASYTNPIDASVVLGATQNSLSGLYPLKISLNQGNFFVLTKDGKVAINTPSFPVYESSPNFHMVGRCAVFEGNCGAGGVALTLYNNPDVVPQVGSIGGSVNLSARNNNRNVVNFAQVQSKILDPIKGQTKGQFLVNVESSGSLKNVLKLDDSVNQIGINNVSDASYTSVVGSGNELSYIKNSKIIGDGNTAIRANNLYVLGSDNSIDLIKNSVAYVLGYNTAENEDSLQGVPSSLSWGPDENLKQGDIVKIENNGLWNGYYIASSGPWTKIDTNVAVAYIGTANILVGSDNVLSGNNVISIGNSSSASGNNIYMLGSNNNVSTQGINGILAGGNNEFNNSLVFGAYNTIVASGVVVLGNNNSSSGIARSIVNGSRNIIASGSTSSIIVGDSNSLFALSGIMLGSSNSGVINLSSIVGQNNNINISSGNIYGSINNISGIFNNVFGNTISLSGSNAIAVGNSIRSSGDSNLVIGHLANSIGSSGLLIGNSTRSSGNNSIVIGSDVAISGHNNTSIGNNNLSSISTNNSNIYGNSNILRSGNFIDSTVIGSNNIVTSGISNVGILGTKNKLTNIFKFDIDHVESVYESTTSVITDLVNSNLFRVGDEVSLRDRPEILTIKSKVPENANQFTIEFDQPVPSSLINQTIFIKSKTLQEEIIYNNSNSNLIIGNQNESIGMSGLIIGNVNYSSGNSIYNLSSLSRISGKNIVNIGSSISVSSGNNIISIGNNLTGSVKNNLTSIGFNNTAQADSTSIIGSDNTIIDGNIFGSGNIIYERNTLVIGDSNTAVGYSKDETSRSNRLFASGTYDAALNVVILDQNSDRFFSPSGPRDLAQKLILQLVYNGKYMPAFAGYTTQIRGNQLSFDLFGPTYTLGNSTNGISDTFNPITLQDFIKQNLQLNSIPENINVLVYPVTEEQKIVVGNNNTLIRATNASIFGDNNKYGIDLNLTTGLENNIYPVSGLIVGSSNTIGSESFKLFEGTANAVTQWRYTNGSSFQGAIGADITNNDPDSIHFGYGDFTFKIFNNGGRKDRTFYENTNGATAVEVFRENVGRKAFRRGILFNNNYNNDSIFGIMGQSELSEPVLVGIPGPQNRVGINTSDPLSTLDVSGTIRASSVNSVSANFNNLALPSGASRGYFLTSADNSGNVEWKSGLKIDFQGLPGTLIYWSGTSLTEGKIQPMSQIVSSPVDTSVNIPFNQVTYNPSSCVVARSGLVFDQYLWCDKYSVMSLDGLRRNVLADVLSSIEDDAQTNPYNLEYVSKLLNHGRSENRTPESYYVPYSANVLYFIPEFISLRSLSPANQDTIYSDMLDTAGYNREGIFAIGRRNNTLPSPNNDNIEETATGGSFAASALPNGLVAPQNIISTIPKKNSNNKRVHFKFNRNEMTFHEDLISRWSDIENATIASYLKPMESSADTKGWWDAVGAPADAVVPIGNDTDIDRSIPTAFNMGLEEIDFVIYGTGSKYKDTVSKFIVGSESNFKGWTIDPDTPLDLPCVTKTPAFYYNASINSFMLHTTKPSWIPLVIPDNQCNPCGPKQSGVWFADLTVRGWIATSGIRIGTGLTRQIEVDPNNSDKVREVVDAAGKPLFRSTRGMYLRSDAYGFAVWDEGPDGVSRSSNDIIYVPASTETALVEGSLDPLIDIANFPLETTDTLTSARLIRDTLNVKSDAENISNNFRIRGITRNTLLFAQNPSTNTYYRTGTTNKFNEAPYQNNNATLNESTVDGTENLFYYGYSNALAGVLVYNSSLQKTEILVDGDATRRVKPGDILRLAVYYKPENYVDGQAYPQKILKVPVLGVNTIWLNGQINIAGKTLQTQVILGEKLSDIDQATYTLDYTDQLRQVALMSENVGGYLTFNFPGSSPELVLSNRDGVPNLFNTSGKKIDFAVYGGFKNTRPDPSIYVDSTSKTVGINTSKSVAYGNYQKTITFNNSLLSDYKSNINSPIYYDYGWQDKHILGTLEETSTLIKISGSINTPVDFKIGDIIEIIYDNTQKIIGQIAEKTISTTTQGGLTPWEIRVSLTAVNPGLIDNKIGNISRSKDSNGNITSDILNNNVKIKIIKRQLDLSLVGLDNSNENQTRAEGDIPLYASLSVKGLTYTDGLMLSDKDERGNIIVPNNSVLYNRYGMVFGSNLRFFVYDDFFVARKNQHLLYNTNIPAVVSTGTVSLKIGGNVPVFADTTLKGSTKIEQLHIDTLNSFDTIDGGVVTFGGTCRGSNLQC